MIRRLFILFLCALHGMIAGEIESFISVGFITGFFIDSQTDNCYIVGLFCG